MKNKTYSIVVYHYPTGKWRLMASSQVEFLLAKTLETFNKSLTKEDEYVFRSPILVEMDYCNFKEDGTIDAVTANGELPDIMTLEDSITNNKKVLSGWNFKYINERC